MFVDTNNESTNIIYARGCFVMKRNFSVMLPGAIGVDTGGLIAGVVLL